MDKTIVTGFMIVVSVVATIMLFNALYPAIQQSSDAMIAMKSRLDDRLAHDIELVHGTGELNSGGLWQDVNGDSNFDIYLWVKNIGSARVVPVEKIDLFVGPEGNFVRIPHQSNAGGVMPYWTYTIENDSEWNPTATLAIEVHYGVTLSSGRYFAKIVLPNGVTSDFFFGF